MPGETSRDVKVTARVERAGDPGAIRDTAEDIRSLAPAADEAADALEQIDEALDADAVAAKASRIQSSLGDIPSQAGRAKDGVTGLKGALGQLDAGGVQSLLQGFKGLKETLDGKQLDDVAGSLDQLGENASGAQGRLAQIAVALEALQISFAVTRTAIDTLREQFGIDIDAMVSDGLKLEGLAEKILGFQRDLLQQGDTLRNQQDLFEKFDLDGFSSDTEKNAQIIDDAFRKIGLAVNTAQGFLSKFDLNGDELIRQAEEFAEGLEAALQVNPDLDLEVLAERTGSQLQAFLDGLIATGQQIPPAVQEWADRLGVLPSKTQEKLDELNAFLQAYNLDADNLIEQAEQFVEHFEQALDINPDLNLEAFGEQAESAIQSFLDGIINAGEQIPPKLQGIADQFGILPTAVEEHLEKVKAAAESILGQIPGIATTTKEQLSTEVEGLKKVLEENLGGFQGVFQLPPEQKEAVKQQIEEIVNALRGMGEKIDPVIADHANRVGVLVGAWERAAEGTSSSAQDIITSAQQMADGVDQAAQRPAESITVLVEGVDELGNKMVESKRITAEAAKAMTLEELEGASPRLKDYVKALKEADEGLQGTEKSADQTGKSLEKPAEEAEKAGKSVSGLAESSEKLAKSTEDSAKNLESQANSLDELNKKTGEISANLDTLLEKMNALGAVDFAASLVGQANDVNSSLETLMRNADEAARRIANIDQAAQPNAGVDPISSPVEVV